MDEQRWWIVRVGGKDMRTTPEHPFTNTRTGQALEQAGVARSQWNIVDQTGNSMFERLLSMQLSRNNLTNRGIANPVWNGL